MKEDVLSLLTPGLVAQACYPPRFFLSTGRSKSPATGFGKSDRFDRLPVKIGQIQIQIQIRQFKRFGLVSRPVRFEW